MTAVVAALPGPGGNRLPRGHEARGRTHHYERVRELPPDPLRRNMMTREHALRAATLAFQAGDLTIGEMQCLEAMAKFSNARLVELWPSLRSIGLLLGRSARTAGRLTASLREKGWLVCRHRFRHVQGIMVGTSSVWRIDVPTHWWSKVPKKGNGRYGRRSDPKPAPSTQQQHRPEVPPPPAEEPQPGATARGLAKARAMLARQAEGPAP